MKISIIKKTIIVSSRLSTEQHEEIDAALLKMLDSYNKNTEKYHPIAISIKLKANDYLCIVKTNDATTVMMYKNTKEFPKYNGNPIINGDTLYESLSAIKNSATSIKRRIEGSKCFIKNKHSEKEFDNITALGYEPFVKEYMYSPDMTAKEFITKMYEKNANPYFKAILEAMDSQKEEKIPKSILSDRPDGEPYKNDPEGYNREVNRVQHKKHDFAYWRQETDGRILQDAVLYSNTHINYGRGLDILKTIVANEHLPEETLIEVAAGKLDNGRSSMMTNKDVREVWAHILKNKNCPLNLGCDIAIEILLNKDNFPSEVYKGMIGEVFQFMKREIPELKDAILQYHCGQTDEKQLITNIMDTMKEKGMSSVLHTEKQVTKPDKDPDKTPDKTKNSRQTEYER